MSADHETDSTIENIKSWEVEWSLSVEGFDDYSKALDFFNLKSNQGEDTILYEIQKSKSDGSIVKRIPILNTKQSKKRKEELEKETQQIHQQKEQQATTQHKNKIGDIKYRIIILVIIVIAFLILLYVLSQLVTSSNILDSHFLLISLINNNIDFSLISFSSFNLCSLTINMNNIDIFI